MTRPPAWPISTGTLFPQLHIDEIFGHEISGNANLRNLLAVKRMEPIDSRLRASSRTNASHRAATVGVLSDMPIVRIFLRRAYGLDFTAA